MSSRVATPSPVPPTPRTPRLRLPPIESFGLSHPGRVRDTNEDAYGLSPALGFFAVADGVGGHQAGEVASRMAIDVVRVVIEDAAAAWPDGMGAPLLAGAVQAANASVHAAASRDRARAGMGTTFTGLLVLRDRAVVAHAGDSRAYLQRGAQLHRLTDDHTLVNAYVQAGVLTAEKAATSTIRNVITRAVGGDATLKVDTRVVGIERGDTFLLASDGLHGVVGDAEIAAVLLGERDLTRAAAQLVERANDAGGPDNVTVVLVRIG